MSKLLMITYKFPPMKSIGAVRTFGMYKNLIEYFEEVRVVTTDNRHRIMHDHYDLDGVHIEDIKTLDYRTLFNRDKKEQSVVDQSKKDSPLLKLLLKLNSSYPTVTLFGEGGYFYIKRAIQRCRQLIQNNEFTHILSSFSPLADHIIAHQLKKEYPHLYWIADFRDLYVDPTSNNKYFPTYQNKYIKRLLSRANLVTTVSKGLATHLKKLHGDVHVLHNGIVNSESHWTEPYDKFTLCYTGSMYQEKRNPDIILRVIQKMIHDRIISKESIQLIYAGKDSGWWKSRMTKFDLNEIFVDKGMVSRELAKEIQKKSHINVLLTYTSTELSGNITGKVYEYIAARMPIICIINGPYDEEMKEVLAHPQYLVGSTLHEKFEDELANFVLQLYTKWHSKENPYFEYDQKLIDYYSWPNQIKGLVEQIFKGNIKN